MQAREVSVAEFGLLNERTLSRLRVCVFVAMVLSVGLFWAIAYLAVRYQQGRIRELDARIAAYRRQVDRIPVYRRALQEAMALRRDAQAKWEEARRKIPPTAQRAQLVAQLLEVSEAEGVTLRNLHEVARLRNEESEAVVLIGEAVAPYERLAYWLWRLEQFERYIRITQLRVAADKENCRAIVRLSAPYGDLNDERSTSRNRPSSPQAHRGGERRL